MKTRSTLLRRLQSWWSATKANSPRATIPQVIILVGFILTIPGILCEGMFFPRFFPWLTFCAYVLALLVALLLHYPQHKRFF